MVGDCVRLILGFISWVFSFSGLKIFLFCVDIDNLIWIQHRHIHLLDVDLVLFIKQRFSERGFIKGNDILRFFGVCSRSHGIGGGSMFDARV